MSSHSNSTRAGVARAVAADNEASDGSDSSGNDFLDAVDEDEESEDEEAVVDHVPLGDLILDINDPRRMDLTLEEAEWAWNIKDAIAEDRDLAPVSDMMCTQLAIITQGNTRDAMERARQLQAYRETYQVLDTAEDAMRVGRFCMNMFPRALLSLSFFVRQGH